MPSNMSLINEKLNSIIEQEQILYEEKKIVLALANDEISFIMASQEELDKMPYNCEVPFLTAIGQLKKVIEQMNGLPLLTRAGCEFSNVQSILERV